MTNYMNYRIDNPKLYNQNKKDRYLSILNSFFNELKNFNVNIYIYYYFRIMLI